MDRKAALDSYGVVFNVRTEIFKRDPRGKILEPLLHNEDDAVRVCAAASLAAPGDDRCIKILKDVAERPELNPSNAVILARFFLDNINKQLQMRESARNNSYQ